MSDRTSDPVAAAQAAVDGANRKIEKLQDAVAETKEALARYKDELKDAKAAAKAEGDSGNSVSANAETAHITGSAS